MSYKATKKDREVVCKVFESLLPIKTGFHLEVKARFYFGSYADTRVTRIWVQGSYKLDSSCGLCQIWFKVHARHTARISKQKRDPHASQLRGVSG